MQSPSSSLLYSHTFDYRIKHIHCLPNVLYLLVECMSPNHKEQHLMLVHATDLGIMHEYSIDENRLGSIVKSFDTKRFVMANYHHQYNPDKYDVSIFEWQNPKQIGLFTNTRILDTGNNWIKMPHPYFENKFSIISLDTLQELKALPPTQMSNPKNILIYPTQYTTDSPYFLWFESFLQPLSYSLVHHVEYLQYSDKIILGFYIKENNALTQHLIILDSKGKKLNCFILECNLPGVGKDTFFVLNNQLLFITDQKILNSYEL